MAKIIQFNPNRKICVKQFIDFDKGWKFTEEDKDFLVTYYSEYINVLNEECGGDFVEDCKKILDSILEKGVEASKELIQQDARISSEAVNDYIYEYYEKDSDILKLIENSILSF